MNTVLPYGSLAWLVEREAGDVIGFAAAVREVADDAVVDVVPGARTVLVQLRDRRQRDRVGGWLAELQPAASDGRAFGDVLELAVTYDGDDLADVAATCGLSVDEVVERHQAPTYRCAFCGFAPGFAYLTGLDRLLHLPRRPTPRTRVPAGSVAIAAEYTAVYPSVSPGGWHLIGRTDATTWDVTRDQPALVRPGTSVRFVAV